MISNIWFSGPYFLKELWWETTLANINETTVNLLKKYAETNKSKEINNLANSLDIIRLLTKSWDDTVRVGASAVIWWVDVNQAKKLLALSFMNNRWMLMDAYIKYNKLSTWVTKKLTDIKNKDIADFLEKLAIYLSVWWWD